MADPHFRWRVAFARVRNNVGSGNYAEAMTAPRAFKCAKIIFRATLPDHRPAIGIGAFAQALPPGLVGQQSCDLATESCDIAKRNQNAAPVGEQLPRMPIWRRYDGLTKAVAVGQCTRRHLRFI